MKGKSNQQYPKKTTRPGTPPNHSKKPAVPGSGRNRPAKGYDPITKTWHQHGG